VHLADFDPERFEAFVGFALAFVRRRAALFARVRCRRRAIRANVWGARFFVGVDVDGLVRSRRRRRGAGAAGTCGVVAAKNGTCMIARASRVPLGSTAAFTARLALEAFAP
jgi:hypothetical protein